MKETQTTNGTPNGVDQPPVLYEDPNTVLRSHFNRTIDTGSESFKEFTESVRKHGVIEPLIARLHPQGSPFKFELIAGERRLLAAKSVKLPKVPIIVRQANDREVIELQTIENDQREDLSPIDRAKNYGRLLEQYEKQDGLTRKKAIEKLCERIGRSRSSVYEILGLVELPDPVKKIIETGRLPASHAALIAQVKNEPDLQATLAKVIAPEDPESKELVKLEQRIGGGWSQRDAKGVMSFRDAKELVKEQLDKSDAREKWRKIADGHRAKGGRVLTEEEHEKHLSQWENAKGGFVAGKEGATDYSGTYPAKTYEQLMGKKAPPATLAHDRDYKPLWLYPKKEANAAIEANGHKRRKIGGGNSTNDSYAKREEREREKAVKLAPVEEAARKELLKLCQKPKPKFPWQLFVAHLIDRGGCHETAKRHGWKYNDVANKVSQLPEAKRLAFLAEYLVDQVSGWRRWGGEWNAEFTRICKYYGVDLKKMEAELAPAPEKPKAITTRKGLSETMKKRLKAKVATATKKGGRK